AVNPWGTAFSLCLTARGRRLSVERRVRRRSSILSDLRPKRENAAVFDRMLDGPWPSIVDVLVVALVVLVLAGVAFAVLDMRRARLRRFLRSLAGTLDGPCREVLEGRTTELHGFYRERVTRIRLELIHGVGILSIGMACRSDRFFRISGKDDRSFDVERIPDA